jgi:hypothetical protein
VKKHRSYAAAVSVGIASLAAVSLWIGVLKPELSRQRTLKNFALRAEPIVGPRDLHVVGAPEYELAYYFGRGIPGWRRSMPRSASRCASYVIVWSNQVKRVIPGASVTPLPLLESDFATSRGRLLLLNVGGPDRSQACADR